MGCFYRFNRVFNVSKTRAAVVAILCFLGGIPLALGGGCVVEVLIGDRRPTKLAAVAVGAGANFLERHLEGIDDSVCLSLAAAGTRQTGDDLDRARQLTGSCRAGRGCRDG